MPEKVKVEPRRVFFFDGVTRKPGAPFEVPADRVARLVEKGLVAAPEGIGGAAQSDRPAADDARLESALSRISAALSVERVSGEPPADFLERVAGIVEGAGTTSGGGQAEGAASLDGMTKDELLAEAERRGVDAKASMTKAEIIAAIEGK